MKKIGFFFCLLVIALTACDPGFGVDFKIVNDSSHDVVFTSNPEYHSFWENHPGGILVTHGEDSLFYQGYGWDEAELSKAKGILFYDQVYGDTITFIFDDGRRLVYIQEEGEGPYDFEGDHYTWITKEGHLGLKFYDQYGCLTYTITEEDYANSIEP